MSEILEEDEITSDIPEKKKPKKELSRKKKIIKISLLVVGILAGFFVVGTAAVNCFMVLVEGRHIKELEAWKEDAREGIDCIMVLGCSVNSDQTPSRMLKDRLDAAIELYHASPQKILVSGDHAGQYYNEVVVMKDYLIQAGIPSDQIFVDHYGVSTYDSVYRAYYVFGIRRITIVTQKYHMYRALYLANAMGMDADGYIAKYVRYTDQFSRDLREVFARDKDFMTAIFKPKVDSPMDPISLEESGDITNER